MDTSSWLSLEEKKVAEQVDKYFHSSRMTFPEKLFHALLIAQHDLEAHHYCSEDEHQRLLQYINILQGILSKLHGLEKQA
ncbi:MAG TPA: hypothetical protein PLG09_01760 [Syntrophomonadaceae bacterium]|mgnify:CR=1 FL=1|nr:hypothetical protein [Syntrophomonadaceae bacterium]HOQ08832.1 hypothetical protein [Syntrophomonadaceae bacterium]HPU47643.1 hypothetical protein [Syntrophomonadaceae bacterium]